MHTLSPRKVSYTAKNVVSLRQLGKVKALRVAHTTQPCTTGPAIPALNPLNMGVQGFFVSTLWLT